jgi:hypothetical protein
MGGPRPLGEDMDRIAWIVLAAAIVGVTVAWLNAAELPLDPGTAVVEYMRTGH